MLAPQHTGVDTNHRARNPNILTDVYARSTKLTCSAHTCASAHTHTHTHLPVMSSLSHSVLGMLQQGRLDWLMRTSVSWLQLGQWKRWLWQVSAGGLTPVTTASREARWRGARLLWLLWLLVLLLLLLLWLTTCCTRSGTVESGRGTCRHCESVQQCVSWCSQVCVYATGRTGGRQAYCQQHPQFHSHLLHRQAHPDCWGLVSQVVLCWVRGSRVHAGQLVVDQGGCLSLQLVCMQLWVSGVTGWRCDLPAARCLAASCHKAFTCVGHDLHRQCWVVVCQQRQVHTQRYRCCCCCGHGEPSLQTCASCQLAYDC